MKLEDSSTAVDEPEGGCQCFVFEYDGEGKCLKVDGSAGRGMSRKSWLECVNDDMKRLVLKKEMAHDRGPCGARLFMGIFELCKHGKYDVKRIDR